MLGVSFAVPVVVVKALVYGMRRSLKQSALSCQLTAMPTRNFSYCPAILSRAKSLARSLPLLPISSIAAFTATPSMHTAGEAGSPYLKDTPALFRVTKEHSGISLTTTDLPQASASRMEIGWTSCREGKTAKNACPMTSYFLAPETHPRRLIFPAPCPTFF